MKTITFLLAILFAAGLNSSRAQGTWTQKADFGGVPRLGAAGFSIGNTGYLGTGSDGVLKNDFWKFDPSTNAWTQKSNLGARWATAYFSIGSKGYVGTGYAGFGYEKSFWQYDSLTNAWTQKANFGGTNRQYSVGFSIGSKGYIGTGYDGLPNCKNDFWEYDPSNNSWTQKSNFGGAARVRPVGFSIGSKGYIGTGEACGTYENDFWEYDPSTNGWTQKADFGGPARSQAVGFSIGSKGYIGTGYSGSVYLNDFWEYDPATNSWTQKADFGGTARNWAVGFSIGSKGYIGTGYTGSIYMNDFWEYSPCDSGAIVYADADADGYGNPSNSTTNPTCNLLSGYVLNNTDCNDANASIHPNQSETTGDGIDNNCNGVVDENNALNFDGVNDYVAIPEAAINNLSKGTIECWLFLNSKNEEIICAKQWDEHNSYGVFSIGSYATWSGWISVGTPGKLYFHGHNGLDAVASSSNINTGQWYHVAVTFTNTETKFYINSNLDNTVSGDNSIPDQMGVTNTCLGAWVASNGQRYLNGVLDEVRVWNVVRTQEEIQSDMNTSTCGDQTGLVAYYTFDQGIASGTNTSETSLDDLTSNNNNGTLTNFSLTSSTSNWVTGVPGLTDSATFYLDADGDGYGTPNTSITSLVCYPPAGYVSDNTDCNDANPSAHPGIDEVINCADDNCNGIIDEGKWIQKGNFGGVARYNAAGFVISGKVYIGTGKTAANAYQKDFWQYDPATNVWTQKADFAGSKRYKATGFAIGTKGYIGTGYDLNGSLVKTFYEYDIATNAWTQKKAFGGSGRQSAVGFSIGSKGYIGTGGDFLNQHNDFWEYDPVTNTWTQKANAGSDVREAAVGFAIGSKGYIGTGYDGSYKNDFWEYDPASNTWTQKATFAGSARQGATGFSIDTKGYIGTGYDGAYKNDFWKYDPATNTWTQDADFTGVIRAYAVGLSVSGKGYIGTGGAGAGTAYNDFREYNVPLPGLQVYADADGDGFGDPDSSIFASGCVVPSGYVLDNSDCDDNNADVNPDAFPTKLWDKRYGGSNDDQTSYLINTTDGGYLISGISKSPISFEKTEANRDATNATNDYWILKTDASGVKQWDKTIGGTGEEIAQKIVQTADGGYLITGTSYSNVGGDKTQAGKGLSDFWIVKVSSTGTIQWDKDFGGTGDDLMHMVIKTSDGGFLIGGESNSPAGGDKSQGSQGLTDYWIIKLDANGNKLWDKRFGGTKDDVINELRQTSDGGYLLGGRSFSGSTGDKTQNNRDASLLTSDYWIVKTDASGNYQWDKRYGGTAEEFLYDLQPTADYGYLLSGYSKSGIGGDKTMSSQGGSDYWIVKIDASGNKISDFQYGGSADDVAFFLRITPDNGFVVCGQSSSGISGDKTQGSRGQRDYWLVKANSAGTKQWDSRYGGSLNDVTAAMQLTPDGGLIIAGSSYSGITGDKSQDNHDATLATRDFWVVKLSVNNGFQTFYPDADGDGYGAFASPLLACAAPAGYITDNSDCNDNPASGALIHPGASDVCNGIDDNCSGVIDENAITATITPSGSVSTCTGEAITLTANTGSGITYQWLSNNVNISGATNSTYSTSTAASYKVTESNSFGCTSTSAVTTLSVIAKPAATISYSTLDLCGQSSITLTANSGTGLTYQWLKANSPIAGATNQTYVTTKKGSFKVVVTNSSGCSKTSPAVSVIKSCKESTQGDALSNAEMKVYPNPTDVTFTLDLKLDSEQNTEAVIQVLNMTGQVVYDKTTIVVNGALQKEVQLPDAAANGAYLVKVTVSDRVYSAQINYQK